MPGSTKNLYYDSIPKKIDQDIMETIGPTGRWQFFIALRTFFVLNLAALHCLSVSFLAPNVDHWCARPTETTNITVDDWKRTDLPTFDLHCSRYEDVNFTDYHGNNTTNAQIVRCSTWEYDKTFYSSTLLNKWNLVCHLEWLVPFTKSIFMVGAVVSSFIFDHLADGLGRKVVIISSAVITCFFAFWCPFPVAFASFVIVRFFIGFSLGGYYNTSSTLLMDIVVPEMRPVYGLCVQLGWSLGFICLPGLAWFIRDAFWLQIAIAVPTLIHVIFSWKVQESPRWLLSTGKLEQARKILTQAAETNKKTITDIDFALNKELVDMKRGSKKKKIDESLLDVLKKPGLRRLAICLFLIWFINAFIYFGLSFNTNELVGNPFVNFTLSGVMEVPAYCLSIYFIKSIGRKRPLAVCMIAAGVISLILYVIPIDTPQTILAAAIIGKFAISFSIGMLYVFTSELMSTGLHNIGLGSSTFAEGLGSIVAPFVIELKHVYVPAIPQFLFGALFIAGGVLVVLLPEMNYPSIPDAPREDNKIYRAENKDNSENLKNSSDSNFRN